jgi:biotin carboxylase
MPRLLLLLPAATYRADAFLEAANTLQLDVTVASEPAHPLVKTHAPDFLEMDFRDPEQAASVAAAFAATCPVDAVIGVDDVTVVVAAACARTLGLPHNSVESVSAARNKHLMRELLRGQGVPTPRYSRFSIDDDPQTLARRVTFPCVIKPLVLSASCGVIRADDPRQFVTAFRRVGALLTNLALDAMGEPAYQVLVEEFIPGREVALEGLLIDGELRVLALFDKPDPLDGPFFEETIYVTPSRLPAGVQREIEACASRAARALGLRHGPVHGELRVNDAGVWVIELAARSIGGRCSRTLRFAASMSLEELILRHALGLEWPSLDQVQTPAGVMMLPIPRAGILRQIRGEAEARRVPGIEELTITTEVGQRLVPLPEGTRYLGFLVARAETPESVEAALREAHRRLEFMIESVSEETGTRTKVVSF